MLMVHKIRLHLTTMRHLKKSQIFYRIVRQMGVSTSLAFGYRPNPDIPSADISRIPRLVDLDFDPIFLARFNCDEILDNKITLLHHSENVDWDSSWNASLSTHLWRFNMHYCEYVLPLASQYLLTNDARYLEKAKSIILSWIASCLDRKSDAWHPYTISLRLVNWLSFYAELEDTLVADKGFVRQINSSIAEQYVHLATHLEKDLLANHYFENLKTLLITSLYFNDMQTFDKTLRHFRAQVEEQILSDGMHFELSPMYHKIIMESLTRVAATLKHNGQESSFFEARLSLMASFLYSLERNTNRTPLFNDSGDNVAKHKDALLSCVLNEFDINPQYQEDFPEAGYYLIERKCAQRLVKIIFDVGDAGPVYAMGHAHCDALSFECFVDGEPWIVNCGTYAYQDSKRSFFRSTAAHNVSVVDGVEQMECWGEHRVAGTLKARFEGRIKTEDRDRLIGVIKNYQGIEVKRTVILSNCELGVKDESSGALVKEYLYFTSAPHVDGAVSSLEACYAPDFGACGIACAYEFNKAMFRVKIPLKNGEPPCLIV